MTQQYYPPQPQQFQPPQQPQFQPPVQQGPPAWAQPPAQQWAPPIQQQAPAPALANGGLDEFYGQPSIGGGPGISWKGKPDGYTVQGVVPRNVGDGDVSQEVGAPNTAEAGRPQFYRDGRPKFVMSVPLRVQQSQEFPDGEAKLYVRGQLRDELARAMAEAGCQGAPVEGAVITVTLVQRKQGRGAIPQNVFAVSYTPPGGQAPQVQAPQPVQQPQYAPAQPVQQQQYAPQPQQAPVQQPVQQFQQQVPGGTSPAAGYAPQPVQQYAPQAPAQQVQQQAPQQSAPPAPGGLSPEQEQLLAQLNAAKQQG